MRFVGKLFFSLAVASLTGIPSPVAEFHGILVRQQDSYQQRLPEMRKEVGVAILSQRS